MAQGLLEIDVRERMSLKSLPWYTWIGVLTFAAAITLGIFSRPIDVGWTRWFFLTAGGLGLTLCMYGLHAACKVHSNSGIDGPQPIPGHRDSSVGSGDHVPSIGPAGPDADPAPKQ